jgi:hypothetical protein
MIFLMVEVGEQLGGGCLVGILLVLAIVALLFIFNNCCLIMDWLGSKNSSRKL